MKTIKKLFGFFILFTSIIMINNNKCFAEEVKYTNNVIPAMTSNTSPIGVASASSEYITTTNFCCQAYRAFDSNLEYLNTWASAKNTSTGWLEYKFTDKRCITKYAIASRNVQSYIKELPKNWTFEAWDEASGKWVILDTQTNIVDWEIGVKKEFVINNANSYNRYRVNVSANADSTLPVAIGELEMMETVSAPTNLTATPGDRSVQLQWNPVTGAEKYNIKRLEADGTYKTFATVENGSSLTYTDINLSNGTTYYYVVSAVVEGIESSDSNIVSATPQATANATLSITFDNGLMKEYNLTGAEINDFLTWYDNRSNGVGLAYYVFTVKGTVSPYASIKNYIPFNKILYFDVKSYN